LIQELEKQSILIDEQQLGQRLNQSVHQGHRSDFALMLAMLAEDVRFHAQFELPHQERQLAPPAVENLRSYFELPEECPLGLSSLRQVESFSQAKLVHEGRLADVKLENVLTPKPLAFRDDLKHIPTQVMDNTSVHCQHRTKREALNERKPFNANGWLKNIEQTLVKSPLLSMSA